MNAEKGKKEEVEGEEGRRWFATLCWEPAASQFNPSI